jgi:hypothetical protein
MMPAAGGRPEAVERELVDRAHRWAHGLTEHVRGPDTVALCDAALGQTVGGLFAAGDGPVVVVWPELVRWRPDHASGALGDLAAGCGMSAGPMFDGGFYLVAFARPIPELLSLPDDAWLGADPIRLAADAAQSAGFAVGLLRTERGLRTAADTGALLADPLIDEELRRLLSDG